MKKYLTIYSLISLLLIISGYKASAQATAKGSLQKTDVYINVIGSSFQKDLEKAKDVPCGEEIYITIEVDHTRGNLSNSLAVPIYGRHYVNGQLKDSLKLWRNSFLKSGIAITGDPFYDTINRSGDNNLVTKSIYRPVIYPAAMGVTPERDNGTYDVYIFEEDGKIHHESFGGVKQRIVVRAPFEPSPETGAIKYNKYEFFIGDLFYDLDAKKWISDALKTNNSANAVYYQRCNSLGYFIKAHPESFKGTVEEASKDKIITYLAPNDPDEKTPKAGNTLTVGIHNTYEGEPVVLDNVKARILDTQGNEYVIPMKRIDETFKSLKFNLPMTMPQVFYVCQVSYKGRTETRLFVVYK